jgi:hypothetical protein
MFEGPWLERGEDPPLAPGDLVLVFDGWDTRSGPRMDASLLVVEEDGLVEVARSRDRGWAVELLEEARGRVPSRGVEKRALEAEIRRVRRHLEALEARYEALLSAPGDLP